MKFLLVDHLYPAFLSAFYNKRPDVKKLPYSEQLTLLMQARFGTSDFYSSNLRSLGHDAADIIVNCHDLQLAWVAEFAPELRLRGRFMSRAREMKVVEEQVRRARPDVLYIQNVTYFDSAFLSHLRQFAGMLAGQTAYALDWSYDFGVYDLIVSSLRNYVDRFVSMGLSSAFLPLAFEPSVLDRIPLGNRDLEAVFVGGFSGSHRGAVELLDRVADELPLQVWGYPGSELPPGSALARSYQGEAWGLDMFAILSRAKVCLNRHASFAGFANNMRLYEGTGMGCCLLTDRKPGLEELFEVKRELFDYGSVRECIERLGYLLEHGEERAAVARAGQVRTLGHHTYRDRMEDLVDIVGKRMTRSSGVPARSSPSSWRPPRRSLEQTLGDLVRPTPLLPIARWAYRQLRKGPVQISGEHQLLENAHFINSELVEGWKDPEIPNQQWLLVEDELKRMYRGEVIPPYEVAAAAIKETGLNNPHVVEIGCASGYYSEVLSHLLEQPIRYIGIDFSAPLVRQAARRYPAICVLVGDAAALPLRDSCSDIVFSSAAIMHVPAYGQAIDESFRVSAKWCIYHRTPVISHSSTMYLSKKAYGVPVIEIVFNEGELLERIALAGGEVTKVLSLGSYHLEGISEPVEQKTYVCRGR